MEQKYHFFLTLPSPRSKTQRLPALFHPLHSVFRCPCGRGRRASLSFGRRFSVFGLCFPREGRRGGADRLLPRLRAECRPHLWVGSRRFPLLCSFRPFARGRSSLHEETFVSSRRDVCLFLKGRILSATGEPPEHTSAISSVSIAPTAFEAKNAGSFRHCGAKRYLKADKLPFFFRNFARKFIVSAPKGLLHILFGIEKARYSKR